MQQVISIFGYQKQKIALEIIDIIIALRRMQNYSYLQPPSNVHTHRSLDHSVLSQVSNNGNIKRRKFYQINLSQCTEEQIESLNRLKEYLKHKNPSKIYPDSLLLKYCHLGSFMTSNSKQKFQFYEDWVAMPVCSKEKQKGILHSGVFYCYGRDDKYCPTIYFHPNRIDLKNFQIQDYLGCLRTLLNPIQQHMLISGKIQRWNLVVDTRAFNDEKFNNQYEIIRRNLLRICYAYPYRLKRLFIVEKRYNSMWSSSPKVDIVHKLIKDLKFEKLCIRIFQMKDFNKYIPTSQRERSYGGDLDDLCQFWPIKTTNRLTEMNSRFTEGSQSSEEYDSINNEGNQKYFAETNPKVPLCDFKNCTIF